MTPFSLTWRLACVVAIAATGACSQGEGRGARDQAALRAGFDSAAERLLVALRADDPDSVLSLMADDLVLMPPNEPVLKGKAAVRTWYTQLLTQLRTTRLTVADREVQLADEWSTEIAGFEWVLTPVAGGPPVTDRGTYMQLWRREPGGAWRLSRELWNSATPLAAAPPGP